MERTSCTNRAESLSEPSSSHPSACISSGIMPKACPIVASCVRSQHTFVRNVRLPESWNTHGGVIVASTGCPRKHPPPMKFFPMAKVTGLSRYSCRIWYMSCMLSSEERTKASSKLSTNNNSLRPLAFNRFYILDFEYPC